VGWVVLVGGVGGRVGGMGGGVGGMFGGVVVVVCEVDGMVSGT
jgi:hypothetical protein